jgi:DNA-binding winged helix-turn-helix (wHTH) protein
LSNEARVTYHFGPFALHVATRLLMRDREVVPVTSKAFETLLVLVRNAGRVVGKDELLREVWPDAVVEESNLTQTIFMLRKALGDAVRDHRFIVTVPKRGYALVAEVRERTRDEQTTLAPGPARELLGRRHPESTEAHQLCLKGRHFWEKRTAAALEKGIRYFQQAIEKDPQYARAYAGLADCYAILSQCSRRPPTETMPKARAAAIEALRIDDTLAEAHASLGLVKMLYDWDWPGAEAEFQRALAIDPGYATAHHWHGMYLVALGRFDEAIDELERAGQNHVAGHQHRLGLVLSRATVRRGRQPVPRGHRSRSRVSRRAGRHPDGVRRDGDVPAPDLGVHAVARDGQPRRGRHARGGVRAIRGARLLARVPRPGRVAVERGL